MRKTISIALGLVLIASVAAAQGEKKPLSPPAKAEGTVGKSKVTVDYSAPSKRNREIMGGLVPYGKVWRTGANAATTLRATGDIMIGNLHVPAGTYTIYTIPGQKDWTLIVNKQTGQWGTNYDESQDLGRVKMKVKKTKDTLETFNISVKPSALVLRWENTEASVPLSSM